MGYRSKAALCLTAEGEQRLQKKLSEVEKTTSTDYFTTGKSFTENFAVRKDADGAVLRHWDWYKWYSEFPEIQFITEFMNELDYSDYYFCRIGENIDDIECTGGFYENPFMLHVFVDLSFSS